MGNAAQGGGAAPRAGWANLLLSSPLTCLGFAASATAVETARTAPFAANTIGTGLPGVGVLGFDGTNFQLISERSTAGDAASNTVAQLMVQNYAMLFNGTAWDRLIAANAAAGTAGTGLLGAGNMIFDGTLWRTWGTANLAGDGVTGGNVGKTANFNFNNSAFDRSRNNAAANISRTTQPDAMSVANPGNWTVFHAPGGNVQATATKAAGGAGVRHVCNAIIFSITTTGAFGAAVQLNLRDGASGAGTVLLSVTVDLQSAIGSGYPIALPGLNIFGSANTAMTLEFSAAAGVGTVECVNLVGYSTV